MTRLILVALLMMTCSAFHISTATAQDFNGKLILGVNGSQIDNDDIGGFNKGGLLLGGGVSYTLDDTKYLEVQLSFSQKGSRRTDKQQARFDRYNLNFIEMPVMFCYKLNGVVDFRAGLSANYLISAKSDQLDLSNLLNTMDFCALIGAGYWINESWMARVHFNSSLISMRSDQVFYNRTLSFAMVRTFGQAKN